LANALLCRRDIHGIITPLRPPEPFVNPFLSLLGTAALLAAPVDPGGAAKRDRYQKMADELAWTDVATEGLSDTADLEPDYQLHLKLTPLRDGRRRMRAIVETADGKQQLYEWDVRDSLPFVVRDHVFYRAEYHPSSTGCSVLAFDLKAGKELWNAKLKGLGPIDHSKYRNRVRMEKVDDTVFAVYGDESAGKYVELVEYATGRTLGHKVFPKD
jgi:hypothetical protein